MRVRPTVTIITAIRRSVMSIYAPVLDDAEASARVGLATHELLENVLRHSSTGDTVLNIHIDASTVWVETKNKASEANIAQLRKRATSIAAGDPETAYQAAMLESLANDTIGGLGLARICAEAGMKVAVRADGEFVHVIASTTFGAAA